MDICPCRHLPIWTLCLFAHLPTFAHLDICPFGCLSIWTFVHLDVCPFGNLPIWTFAHSDICPFGRLPNWTFDHLDLCSFTFALLDIVTNGHLLIIALLLPFWTFVVLNICSFGQLSICSFGHLPSWTFALFGIIFALLTFVLFDICPLGLLPLLDICSDGTFVLRQISIEAHQSFQFTFFIVGTLFVMPVPSSVALEKGWWPLRIGDFHPAAFLQASNSALRPSTSLCPDSACLALHP